MARYVTEFIATFFLVLIIAQSVYLAPTLAPIAIGFGLVVLVFMGAHISGAHYNPAVTLGLYMRKAIALPDALGYVAAQVGGAFVGAIVAYILTDVHFGVAPGMAVGDVAYGPLEILLSEMLFTFLLVLVILNVARHPEIDGNQFYGFAIGLTVMVGAFAVGPVSGGAFNPAVALGPALANLLTGGEVGPVWYYIVGPLAGGALAVPVFAMQKRHAETTPNVGHPSTPSV